MSTMKAAADEQRKLYEPDTRLVQEKMAEELSRLRDELAEAHHLQPSRRTIMKSLTKEILPIIGTAMCGGFYAGRRLAVYNLDGSAARDKDNRQIFETQAEYLNRRQQVPFGQTLELFP